jgi:phosphoribosylaminoimidazole (AIR) synthetase
MYRVFNMGIGMVIFCSPEQVSEILKRLPEAKKIGKVIPSRGRKRPIIF